MNPITVTAEQFLGWPPQERDPILDWLSNFGALIVDLKRLVVVRVEEGRYCDVARVTLTLRKVDENGRPLWFGMASVTEDVVCHGPMPEFAPR